MTLELILVSDYVSLSKCSSFLPHFVLKLLRFCIVQMAYAALVSLSQTVDQFLVRHQHSYVALHEKQQIHSLHEKTLFLSKFLEDFPREATKLEARITIVANQVEDIFEYHILNKNGSIYGNRRSNARSPMDSLFSGRNLKRLYKELQNPIKEIYSILKEAMEIKSGCCTSQNQMIPSHSSASFSSTLVPNVKDDVVGFEKELMDIKDRVYGESAKLEVIPIVGMGGIGKTTLARYALHDPLALHHFDISTLVSVSQNYDKASVLLSLLNSIDPSSKGIKFEDESLIDERVYKYLKGRRFLIVVDDIWNAKTWDDLRRVFPDDFNGSRIIITTRNLDVAYYVDTCSHTYEMHLMGVDMSWNLLRQKVFEQEHCPPELEEIGREIAEKCRGLPLAIVVIAGVLSKLGLMQYMTWIKIAMNVNEAVNTSDEPFAEILSLSYTYMPHHLRPCFLYLGAFPEDEEIHVSKLIRLWVAEGFLKSNGSKDLEDVAEDCLEDLAKRSLVLINKKRYNGKIKTIKMHDLLRDLCLRKADDEKFLRVILEYSGSSSKGIENSRRLSILSKNWDHIRSIDDLPIHTILIFGKRLFHSWKRCRLLRVMDLMLRDTRSLRDEICELLHLRYLGVTFKTFKNISKVPKCFSKLGNLQTLIIGRSIDALDLCLPSGIWRMRELRHISVWDGSLPDPSADQILPLEKLHTLKRIRGFRCSERILELIPNLNKLGIIYHYPDMKETKWSEYGLNNLIHLQKLENLNLYADLFIYSQDSLSQSLAFPLTLKKLTLSGTKIRWEDMSIVGSLPNLQLLKLKTFACYGSVWGTVEGQFCQLKRLLLYRMDLHDWVTESCHFPRLERLTLCECLNLREIPSDIGEIPTLQLIEVDSCCKSSLKESAKYIEEEQRSFGNHLQVHLNISLISKMDAL